MAGTNITNTDIVKAANPLNRSRATTAISVLTPSATQEKYLRNFLVDTSSVCPAWNPYLSSVKSSTTIQEMIDETLWRTAQIIDSQSEDELNEAAEAFDAMLDRHELLVIAIAESQRRRRVDQRWWDFEEQRSNLERLHMQGLDEVDSVEEQLRTRLLEREDQEIPRMIQEVNISC
ncbi:MAG: hypothetical protein Q9166_001450 [cf. Caloplaca sp. 2 TL-2023]